MRKKPLVFWATISLAMLLQCQLALGGSISGRVARDLDGIGIPGIEVEVFKYGQWVDSALTDSSGGYVVRGLPAGSYYLRTYGNGFLVDEFYDNVVAKSSTIWPPSGAIPVSVSESGETMGIDFSLALGGSISGKVSRDSDGKGMQGVEVIVYETNWNRLKSGWTDSSGEYLVGGLPAGYYLVGTWNTPGYIDEYYNGVASLVTATWVNVIPETTTPNINFSLALGGSISGRITRNGDGSGIEGVEVIVSNSYTEKRTWTDGSGGYTATGLGTGSYYVRTSNDLGYFDKYYPNADYSYDANLVSVVLGVSTMNVNLSLLLGGSISGRVTRDSDGSGVLGVSVSVDGTSGSSGPALTGSDGNYTIKKLRTGTYHVRVQNSLGYMDEFYDDVPVIGQSYPYPPGSTAINVMEGVNTPGINFGLAYGGSISGRVTRQSNGTGIQGIEVHVYNTSWNSVLNTYTDYLGNYSAAGLPTGIFYVGTSYSNSKGYIDEVYDNVRSSGMPWPPSGAAPVSVTQGVETSGINFSLGTYGSISGRVTRDSDGTGIQGVDIEVRSVNSSYGISTTTDYSGYYAAGGIPTGGYYVMVRYSPGFGSEVYDNIQYDYNTTPFPPAGATLVNLTEGVDTPDINFGLTALGSISGRVTRNSDGAGIPNVEIRIYDTSWSWRGYTQANYLGNYATGGLRAGSYYLRTSNGEGYVDEVYEDLPIYWGEPWPPSGASAVTVTDGADTHDINFGLSSSGSISGRVTRQSDGAGIGEVDVYVYHSNGGTISTRADSLGNYIIKGLSTSSYYVRTSNSQGYIDEVYDNIPYNASGPWPPAGATAVSVNVGFDTPDINFALVRYGSISGRVTRRSDGTGIGSIGVLVYNSGGGVLSTSTDPLGYYVIGGIRTGSYYVRTSNWEKYIDQVYDNIVYDPSAPWPPPGATAVNVTEGADTPNTNFALDQRGSISGRVTRESDGSGISGVEVRIYSSTWGFLRSAYTDLLGNYVVGYLQPGSVYVGTSNGQSYVDEYYDNATASTAATPVSVAAATDTPGINFSLVKKGSISGRVTRFNDGRGIQGVEVRLYDSSWNSVTSCSTDSTGNYVVGGLSAGSYYVKASGPGYIDQFYDGLIYDPGSVWPPVGASPVSVGLETDTPGIDFSLKLYGSISGRVSRRSDGTGLPNIQIGVYDPGWKLVASASTDSYGEYAVSRLPTGNYYVKTWNNEGYLDLYYDNVPTKSAARLVSIDGGVNTSNINFSLKVEVPPRVSYRMEPNASYSYETGEHQITSWAGSLDDGYFDLDLGDFDFQFYGFPVNSLRISTNGYMTFGTGGSTFLNSFIPDIQLPNALIAPFWDDLDLTNLTEDRGVWWGLLGTPPNRRLVVEWHQVPSRQYRTEAYSFETILYESIDRIKFQYLNVNSGTSRDWGGSATVGIENFEGTEGVQYTFNGSTPLSNGLAVEFLPEQVIGNTVYVSKDGQCSGYDPCSQRLQDGIDSVSAPTEVEITQETYNEDIILDFDQVILLSGGWTTNFAWCPSYTTINGSITITHGTIILENIIVK